MGTPIHPSLIQMTGSYGWMGADLSLACDILRLLWRGYVEIHPLPAAATFQAAPQIFNISKVIFKAALTIMLDPRRGKQSPASWTVAPVRFGEVDQLSCHHPICP